MMASICLFVLSALYVIATANVLGDATPFNFVATSRTILTDFGPPDPHPAGQALLRGQTVRLEIEPGGRSALGLDARGVGQPSWTGTTYCVPAKRNVA